MNWLIMILAAVGCSWAGIQKARTLDGRTAELEQFLILLEQLSVQLRYRQLPTGELVQSAAETPSLNRLGFLPVCRKQMETQPFSQAWSQGISNTAQEMDWTEEDRKKAALLGEILGASDVPSQQQGIEMLSQMFQDALEQARQEQRQKGKLYRSLGVLSGLGIAVLLW